MFGYGVFFNKKLIGWFKEESETYTWVENKKLLEEKTIVAELQIGLVMYDELQKAL